MALSFPLSAAAFADLVKLSVATWNLVKREEMSGNGGGEWLTTKLGPDQWEAECSSIPMERDEAQRIRARIDALGSEMQFHLYDPARMYPLMDPTGALYGSPSPLVGTVATSRLALTLTAMPNNYALKAGDLFSVVYDTSRRALLELMEDVTSNGSGAVAEFEVRPAIRPGIATSAVISFAKPTAKMKLVPGSVKLVNEGIIHTRLTFTARQTLGKD